jgi:3alpha(or 20beta)-hydroxysteroid dehydrogenase
MIKTPMIEGASDEAAQAARYPIPRFGTSEEVAATMLHIVCEATYSTGSEFCVDGGILAGISVGD